jgi:hypothetical protein
MFKKVIAQVNDYIPKLTKADFDNNLSKVEQEILEIEKKYKFDQQIATNVKFDNKKFTLDQFLKKLKQQAFALKDKKNTSQMYDTSLFQNIGGKNVDISSDDAQEGLKRDIAALERQIQEREQTLAEIDNYVVTLLSGEMSQLNIAHTNAKFVKIADKPSEEEVLEPVEEYFDKLYDNTPGSPNYGKLMTHPEKHRDELSTEAQVKSSKPKFKKK